MSIHAYRQVLDQAQHLTRDEQVQLIADLLASMQNRQTEVRGKGGSLRADDKLQIFTDLAEVLGQQQQIQTKPRHSILELEGLGKEMWEAIDVDQYIEEERNSWGG